MLLESPAQAAAMIAHVQSTNNRLSVQLEDERASRSALCREVEALKAEILLLRSELVRATLLAHDRAPRRPTPSYFESIHMDVDSDGLSAAQLRNLDPRFLDADVDTFCREISMPRSVPSAPQTPSTSSRIASTPVSTQQQREVPRHVQQPRRRRSIARPLIIDTSPTPPPPLAAVVNTSQSEDGRWKIMTPAPPPNPVRTANRTISRPVLIANPPPLAVAPPPPNSRSDHTHTEPWDATHNDAFISWLQHTVLGLPSLPDPRHCAEALRRLGALRWIEEASPGKILFMVPPESECAYDAWPYRFLRLAMSTDEATCLPPDFRFAAFSYKTVQRIFGM
ncbi:hypothetical protein EXIGLDRAFT_773177 [Exidia glandulosa HHB12029]|uniref:Uncharacterized protein n=1 Tax=Exidia glandulosa HHB12029 TaxID=1314781 RepID=A0A165EWY3_EXIGL|nr:hypothetical protein EXIGLDRAFT_773177 [Exidia glandulosa HHB12029]